MFHPVFRHRFARLAACVGLLLLVSGCSGGTQVQTSDDRPLRTLSTAYLQATQKLNRPPKSAEELKDFVPAGTDVNSLLTSPTDGKPYVILWGTDPRAGLDLKPLVIGYEKEGLKGVRSVFTAMGVSLMGPEDFKEAKFPEGHTPG